MSRVRGVIANDSGEDLSDLINDTAERHDVPAELIVALGIAESELNVRSQRWGRHSAEARAALAAGDPSALEAVVATVEQETPGDISFGLFQQTVRWANEGDHTISLENILAVRDLYWDPAHATEVAAGKLGAYLRRYGDPAEALCRYNAPARDGLSNPHRQRFIDGLERAQAFLETNEVNRLAAPSPPASLVEVQWSPNAVPHRPRTLGIIIHSTRGNTDSLEREYLATISHFLNPQAEVSTHVVIGPRSICRMVADADLAWHARENNATHLGIELVHPRADWPFTDFEYEAAAEVVRGWCEKYSIPMEHVTSQSQPGIIGHDETEQGRRDGKSDPGGQFDWSHFMALVRGVVAPTSMPAPTEETALVEPPGPPSNQDSFDSPNPSTEDAAEESTVPLLGETLADPPASQSENKECAG